MNAIIISLAQAQRLLDAQARGQTTAVVSLDLGLSEHEVTLEQERVVFPDGQALGWEDIAQIAEDDTGCYAVEGSELRKIQQFSPRLNRFCSLMPTHGAPTILIAGFIMHRVKGVDPYADTMKKIQAAAPRGQVLDTSTGLGYTAIEAAKRAAHVITIELDPTVLEIARQNPWSRTLFDNPIIEQIIGDSFEVVPTFEAGRFSRVIHDPPAFSLAGELYSGAFYREIYRILKPNGRLFHYIGSLESKSGSGVARGAVRRLLEAGFTRVVRRPEAFGLIAYK
jgi:predicted methyltransferase